MRWSRRQDHPRQQLVATEFNPFSQGQSVALARPFSLKRWNMTRVFVHFKPILYALDATNGGDCLKQGMKLIGENRAAQRYQPLVRFDLNRVRMRDHAPEFRAHARIENRVRDFSGSKPRPYFRKNSEQMIANISPRPSSHMSRNSSSVSGLVAQQRTPPFTAVGVKQIH